MDRIRSMLGVVLGGPLFGWRHLLLAWLIWSFVSEPLLSNGVITSDHELAIGAALLAWSILKIVGFLFADVPHDTGRAPMPGQDRRTW